MYIVDKFNWFSLKTTFFTIHGKTWTKNIRFWDKHNNFHRLFEI